MLGTAIDDPYGVEGGGTQEGLGLLAIRTKMNREKTTREATGKLIAPELFGEKLLSSAVQGYEIHVGETEYLQDSAPFARIHRTGDSEKFTLDGCITQNGRVIGTYLHGIFHDDAFRHAFLAAARSASGLSPAKAVLNWKELRENEFERLAGTVAGSVDLKRMLGFVGLTWPAVPVQEGACVSRL
jgi:adenosylcobyric acid synthase